MLVSEPMNPLDLTVTQLRRAAAIKQQLDALNKELRGILGGSNQAGAAPKKKRTMSAAARRKIAASQRARWASLRRSSPATAAGKAGAKAKKKRVSPATRARLSAKLKAYWAAKRSGKK